MLERTERDRQVATILDTVVAEWTEILAIALGMQGATDLEGACRPARSWSGWQNATRDSSGWLTSGLYKRCLRDWRALYDLEQEVFFPQVHPPGRETNWISPMLANWGSPSPTSPIPTSSSSSSSATRGSGGRTGLRRDF